MTEKQKTGRDEPGTRRTRGGGRAGGLSRLAVLAALALLLYTCHACCPEAERALRRLVTNGENSPAAQAFYSLTQSLREGEDAAQAFSESYQVLKGAAD